MSLLRTRLSIGNTVALLPLHDGLRIDDVAAGKIPYALLTKLYRSTDLLRNPQLALDITLCLGIAIILPVKLVSERDVSHEGSQLHQPQKSTLVAIPCSIARSTTRDATARS